MNNEQSSRAFVHINITIDGNEVVSNLVEIVGEDVRWSISTLLDEAKEKVQEYAG